MRGRWLRPPPFSYGAGRGHAIRAGSMSENDQTTALLQQAEEARRRGDDGAAARLWRQALEYDPGSAVALNGLGMQALARNDPEAEALFARATQADPGAAALWMNLATARRQQGDMEGERQALDG